MAEYLIQDTTLSDIADAIREKSESSDMIPVSSMASLIQGIRSGSMIESGTINFSPSGSTFLNVPCTFEPKIFMVYPLIDSVISVISITEGFYYTAGDVAWCLCADGHMYTIDWNGSEARAERYDLDACGYGITQPGYYAISLANSKRRFPPNQNFKWVAIG